MNMLGPILHSFFEDHLKVQKGLRQASIKSYRDALLLFLHFVSQDARRKISRLSLADLTCERVIGFLEHLEQGRRNCVSTRNQRLAALHTFFEYAAGRVPEMLSEVARVEAIASKRTPPPETHYLERDEVQALFASLPANGHEALRDRALLLFLYNTGARVQEVADIRVENLELGSKPRVRLHGKGGKWRICPLWDETASILIKLLAERGVEFSPSSPVFHSRQGRGMTRSGIYKVVRRHTNHLGKKKADGTILRVSPESVNENETPFLRN